MRTNVPIDLTDGERDKLADLIAGKRNAKLVTRAQVVELCQQHIAGLVATGQPLPQASPGATPPVSAAQRALLDDMTKPDPEDVALMARPNDPGYVYGWNKVKRSRRRT